MEHEIGQAAGKIWDALNGKDAMTALQIAKAAGLPSDLTHQGIGWLAREGKLERADGRRGKAFRIKA